MKFIYRRLINMSISISINNNISNSLKYSSAGMNKSENTADGEDKLKYDNIDNEIKDLEDQKQTIQDEIKRLSGTAKLQEENKDLLSELKSEMEMIDSEIEEKRSEKLEKSTNSINSKKSINNDKNEKAGLNINNYSDNDENEKQAVMDSNMIILSQQVTKFKDIKDFSNLKKSLKTKAAITRKEAELDGNRNRVGDAKKYEQAAKEDAMADKLGHRIAEKVKAVQSDNNKIKNNVKKENNDAEKHKDNSKSSIDVFV